MNPTGCAKARGASAIRFRAVLLCYPALDPADRSGATVKPPCRQCSEEVQAGVCCKIETRERKREEKAEKQQPDYVITRTTDIESPSRICAGSERRAIELYSWLAKGSQVHFRISLLRSGSPKVTESNPISQVLRFVDPREQLRSPFSCSLLGVRRGMSFLAWFFEAWPVKL